MSGKRQLPYYSEVQGFDLQQRRRLEEDPSRCGRRWAAGGRQAGGTWFLSALHCRLHSDKPIVAAFREREAPKVWQAKEQTEFDEYDAITVRLGARAPPAPAPPALPLLLPGRCC